MRYIHFHKMALGSSDKISGFEQLLNLLRETKEEFVNEIHEAVYHGEKIRLEKLLATGDLDLNLCDEAGKTALHISIERKHYDLVDILLKGGVSVNATSDKGDTPLHLCNDLEASKKLIEFGACINIRNTKGETPLHTCTKRESASLMEYLLTLGADVNATDKEGETAMTHVTKFGVYNAKFTDMAKLLLKFGADVNKQDDALKSPLHHACESSPLEIVKLLLEKGAKLDILDGPGQCPIHYCLKNYRCEEDGLLDLLGVALSNKEAPNCVDIRGRSILHMASVDQSDSVVELILNYGADINQFDYQGKVPLHYAAKNTDYGTKILSCLVGKGCSVNKSDYWGQTPLHEGVANENLSFVNCLISNNADLHRADDTGITPIHVASMKYNTAFVKCLLDNNADVNVPDINNSTPLHLAAWVDADDTANELINSGANINAKDSRGQTALDVACFRRAPATISVLAKYIDCFQNIDNFSNVASKLLDYETILTMLKENNSISRTDDNLQRYLESVLGNPCIGRGMDDDEASEIQKCMEELVQKLAIAINKYDRRLKCTVLHAGSCSEGTKTRGPDEFDFMLCLENLSKQIDFKRTEEELIHSMHLSSPFLPGSNAGTLIERMKNENLDEKNISISDYLRISLKQDDTSLPFVDLFGSHQIPCHKMFYLFGQVIDSIIFGKDFPKYPQLFPDEVTINPALKLRWRGCKYKELMIDIDLVPAVYLPTWSDKYEKDLRLLTPGISRITSVAVPKMTAVQHYYLWRSSLALVETAVFRNLRPNIRNSYTVCKALISSEILPHISFESYDGEKYVYKLQHSSVTSEDMEDVKFHESPEQSIPSYILKMTFLSVVEDIAKTHGIDFVFGNGTSLESGPSQIASPALESKNHDCNTHKQHCTMAYKLHNTETELSSELSKMNAENPDLFEGNQTFYGPAINMYKAEKSLDLDADIVKEVFSRCVEAITKQYVPSTFNPCQNVLGAEIISGDAYKVETFLKTINALIATNNKI